MAYYLLRCLEFIISGSYRMLMGRRYDFRFTTKKIQVITSLIMVFLLWWLFIIFIGMQFTQGSSII